MGPFLLCGVSRLCQVGYAYAILLSMNPTVAYEYTVIHSSDWDIIQSYTEEGWELVSAVPSNGPQRPQPPTEQRKRLLRPGIRNAYLIVFAVIALLVLLFTFVGRPPANEIPISQLMADVRDGKVTRIVILEESNTIRACYGECRPGDWKRSQREPEISLSESFDMVNIAPENLPQIEVERAPTWGNYLGLLGVCLPTLLLAAMLFYVTRLPNLLRRSPETSIVAFIFRRSKQS